MGKNIFMFITQEGLMVCKITWFLRKTKRCCVETIVTGLWMFWKHDGKTEEKLIIRTVYNLFGHWNTALWSDFRCLKTLLVTRSVFHLFWSWRPVGGAPYMYQPRNAHVLKRSRPRTSDNSIWASRIVVGLYFLAFLPGACHFLTFCSIRAWNKSVGFASWPFEGSITTHESLAL